MITTPREKLGEYEVLTLRINFTVEALRDDGGIRDELGDSTTASSDFR